jgi:Steigviridae replicative DNA helicase
MSLYDDTISEIEQKKKNKEAGKFNGIPFFLERYREYFDSFEKGNYIGILANSGVGKSRFMRSIIYDMIEFSMMNDYKVKLLYFALEDDKKQINKKIIAHYLYCKHGISLSQSYLNSIHEPLPDKYLELIKKNEKFWRMLEDIVYIINDATSPNEIQYHCEKAHAKYGKEYHMIAFIDNYANITKDPEDKSEWESVRRLSRNIVRLNLCKKLDMTVIALLQCDVETEKNTFRNVGAKGLISIEPNASSLGDVKVIIRDFFVLFGLFSPWRYEIKEYPYSGAYSVEILRGRLLALLMLKNNNGEIGPRLAMHMDAKHEVFKELPKIEDTTELQRLYTDILNEEKMKREKNFKNKLF